MSIDWSNAPEGANKAGFTGHDQYLQFYRIPGIFGDYWSEKRGWCGNDFPTCANYLFDRPEKVEWNGQCLPPVGITCESWRSGVRRIVKILGHGDEYIFVREDDGREILLSIGDGREFRPIRTPEQIAAEEREKAINQMISDAGYVDPKIGTFVAMGNLYDAGYRRQESST
ncbi:TPA: hypothetical protein L6B55_22815 [Pseudomonas aeruginosa]|nr:hypothetical protein [Pseudomonas aeruginosa]